MTLKKTEPDKNPAAQNRGNSSDSGLIAAVQSEQFIELLSGNFTIRSCCYTSHTELLNKMASNVEHILINSLTTGRQSTDNKFDRSFVAKKAMDWLFKE